MSHAAMIPSEVTSFGPLDNVIAWRNTTQADVRSIRSDIESIIGTPLSDSLISPSLTCRCALLVLANVTHSAVQARQAWYVLRPFVNELAARLDDHDHDHEHDEDHDDEDRSMSLFSSGATPTNVGNHHDRSLPPLSSQQDGHEPAPFWSLELESLRNFYAEWTEDMETSAMYLSRRRRWQRRQRQMEGHRGSGELSAQLEGTSSVGDEDGDDLDDGDPCLDEAASWNPSEIVGMTQTEAEDQSLSAVGQPGITQRVIKSILEGISLSVIPSRQAGNSNVTSSAAAHISTGDSLPLDIYLPDLVRLVLIAIDHGLGPVSSSRTNTSTPPIRPTSSRAKDRLRVCRLPILVTYDNDHNVNPVDEPPISPDSALAHSPDGPCVTSSASTIVGCVRLSPQPSPPPRSRNYSPSDSADTGHWCAFEIRTDTREAHIYSYEIGQTFLRGTDGRRGGARALASQPLLEKVLQRVVAMVVPPDQLSSEDDMPFSVDWAYSSRILFRMDSGALQKIAKTTKASITSAWTGSLALGIVHSLSRPRASILYPRDSATVISISRGFIFSTQTFQLRLLAKRRITLDRIFQAMLTGRVLAMPSIQDGGGVIDTTCDESGSGGTAATQLQLYII